MAVWFLGSDKYSLVAPWATGTVYAVGALVTQKTTPAAGSERVFVCTTAGTSHATTEPVWVTTKGAIQPSDNGVIWQECTGRAAVNGDTTDVIRWPQNTAVILGQPIKDASNNLFLCTTGGTTNNTAEPTWNTTPGAATNETGSSVTWVCIGTTFAAWAAPHARLRNAASFAPAGDTILVSDAHAATEAAIVTVTFNGTTLLTQVICVDRTASLATGIAGLSGHLKTTATDKSTGASTAYNTVGSAYIDGLTVSCGTGSTSITLHSNIASAGYQYWKNCTMDLSSSGGAGVLNVGQTNTVRAQTTVFDNVSLKCSNSAHGLVIRTPFTWKNSAAALTGSAVPATLVKSVANNPAVARFEGLDLSPMGSGTLVATGASQNIDSLFQDCRLGTGFIISATPISPGSQRIWLRNCDSGATNYNYSKTGYEGTVTDDTSTTRASGASDGTTKFSLKLTGNGNASWITPLYTDWMLCDNFRLVARTLAVPIISSGTLTNADIFIEIRYPGSASYPLGTYDVSTRSADIFAAGSNQPTDSVSVWANPPATPVKQVLQATITPAVSGPIWFRIGLIKNTTVWADLLAVPGAKRAYMAGEGGFNVSVGLINLPVGMNGGCNG